MDEIQEKRLVVAFEKIAKALGGLHEESKRAGARFWPEPKQQKEAVWSRVETDEDRAKKSLGASDKPIEDWLTDIGDPEGAEYIGERTKQWLRDNAKEDKEAKVSDAGSETPIGGQAGGTSIEAPEGKG
jgi:hypothetical protein